jgi:hypothetical protein
LTHLQEALVRAIDVFEFGIQDGVDPMLVGKEAESVLPPVPGKQSTVAAGSLTIKVYLRGPPAPNTVFEFRRLSPEPVAISGLASDAFGGNFLGSSIWCV